jgi:hypothetical protein
MKVFELNNSSKVQMTCDFFFAFKKIKLLRLLNLLSYKPLSRSFQFDSEFLTLDRIETLLTCVLNASIDVPKYIRP